MMQTCPRVSLPVRLQETLRKYTYVIVLDQKALRKRKSCRVYLLGPAAAGATAPCGGGLLLEL